MYACYNFIHRKNDLFIVPNVMYFIKSHLKIYDGSVDLTVK